MKLRRSLRRHARRAWIVALIAAGASVALPPSALAQDGREGFVLNLGAGAGVLGLDDFLASTFEGGRRETNFAIGTDIKIGVAFSDQVLIHYSNDAYFSSPSGAPIRVASLNAIGVLYFLKPAAPSLYVGGAIGIASFSSISLGADVFGSGTRTLEADGGFGFAVSGGYEFARHWLLDFDVMIGQPKERDSGESLSILGIRLGVSWLAY